jgi:hypothetical protein
MTHSIVRVGQLAVLLAFVSFVAPHSPAAAQSDADLRREVQRLELENAELKERLRRAEDRIKQLEAQIQSMQTSGGTGATPAEEEQVSIDETQPLASPRAIVAALRASYETAMDGMEMGEPDSRERTRYRGALERWSVASEREMRGTIEWRVAVAEVKPHANGKDFVVVMQAVDPKYGTKLGKPFEALLPGNRTRNLEGGTDGQWELKGRLTTDIILDERITGEGAFENAMYLGSFAELRYAVEVITLVRAEEEMADESGDDGGN